MEIDSENTEKKQTNIMFTFLQNYSEFSQVIYLETLLINSKLIK